MVDGERGMPAALRAARQRERHWGLGTGHWEKKRGWVHRAIWQWFKERH